MAEKIMIKYMPLDKIQPYEGNPRRVEKAIKAVQKSIKEFGFLNPIIVDQDNVIICGHTRFLAAQRLGLEQVPVIMAADLSEEQVRAFRLADNRVAEIATWDKEKLQEELAHLKDIFDMTQYGFKSDDAVLSGQLKMRRHRCPRCGYEW